MLYEQCYKEFCDEVHQILGCYLFWQMINERSASNDALMAMNRTPLSWTLLRYSLLANLFISLARVFDTSGTTMSIATLISCCISDVSIFNRDHVRQRNLKTVNGNSPEGFWDEHVKNCYEPSAQDFYIIKGEIEKRRKLFRELYLPVRDKIIAHKERNYVGKTDELWAKVDIQKLEEIIWFLYEIKGVLFDSFHNGHQPILKGRKPLRSVLDIYEKDFKYFLNHLTST